MSTMTTRFADRIKSAGEVIGNHIRADWRMINDLERQIDDANRRIAAAEELLPYTQCDRCDCELMGGFDAAQEALHDAQQLGRKSMLCFKCDRQAVVLFMVKQVNVELMSPGTYEKLIFCVQQRAWELC